MVRGGFILWCYANLDFVCHNCLEVAVPLDWTLTLCQVQRPKTSARVRRQSVPKHSVAISKLRYFHTRKFLYNLTRISWIITVRDFCYFPRAILHCLCVQSESERVFESGVKETRFRFSRRISIMIQTTTNDSLAFALKICFKKL